MAERIVHVPTTTDRPSMRLRCTDGQRASAEIRMEGARESIEVFVAPGGMWQVMRHVYAEGREHPVQSMIVGSGILE